MRIGVICEGHSDRAVIENILKGAANIDSSSIISILPAIYGVDETDKGLMGPKHFSNWTLVKKECETQSLMGRFFSIEGQESIIIHIDTAEAHLYHVNRPTDYSNDYCETLRKLVVDQINNWLQGKYIDKITYAVSIEEIDSWILTIHEETDTCLSSNPKKRLRTKLSKKGINTTTNYKNFKELSKDLSKKKLLDKYAKRNCSLEHFYLEVIQKFNREGATDEN